MNGQDSSNIDTNTVDRGGKKIGIWKENIKGKYWIGRYENGLKEGLWIGYHSIGMPAILTNYSGGKKHGQTVRLDLNGMLTDEYSYLNDSLHGDEKLFAFGGKLIRLTTYRNGKIKVKKINYYTDSGARIKEES